MAGNEAEEKKKIVIVGAGLSGKYLIDKFCNSLNCTVFLKCSIERDCEKSSGGSSIFRLIKKRIVEGSWFDLDDL